MKIGLLQAETLPPYVVKQFGSYGNMFERLIEESDSSHHFQYYAADQGELPKTLSECDAYVVTGSRYNAYDQDPWIENLKELIREIDTKQHKCLAICFGHQVVAEALGGKVERSQKGWGVGVAEFQVVGETPYSEDLGGAFRIYVSHQDQVIRLPKQAKLLAKSNFCPFGAYSIGNHIFSMQGHPEFSSAYLERLITKRELMIGKDRSASALISLKNLDVFSGFSALINNFLKN